MSSFQDGLFCDKVPTGENVLGDNCTQNCHLGR